VPPRSHLGPSQLIGQGHSPAVSGVILGASGLAMLVGAPVARAEPPSPEVPSPEAVAIAHRELWGPDAGYLAGLARPDPNGAETQGDRVINELAREIERRMMVTPRDLADPNTIYVDGHPGYKQLPPAQLQAMLVDAIERIPIGELPAGTQLARIVRGIPGAASLDVEHMSFKQVESALSASGRSTLTQTFSRFLSDHRVEAAVIGFGTITATRMASRDAAGFIDGALPSLPVWHGRTRDGRLGASVDLRYRDRRLFPDVDLRASAHQPLGSGFDVRGAVSATIPLDRDALLGSRTATPAPGAGTPLARSGDPTIWTAGDATARLHVDALAGLSYTSPDTHADAVLRASFGPGIARGTAPGRLMLTLDADRRIRMFEDGHLGLFFGAGVDVDGRHPEIAGGAVLRFRF
jgi:hypothetical protein